MRFRRNSLRSLYPPVRRATALAAGDDEALAALIRVVLDSAAENAGIADGEDVLREVDRIGEVDDKVLLEDMGGRLSCHDE
jgi:hypothetical protein